MTLSKLSIRNAKRQAKDYLVYFITIVMAAAFLYAFNCLIFSQELLQLSSMLDSMPIVVISTSVVVVCILGWLVSYTIKFMLERRSRELGTYILIGLENKQVARLFFLENLTVGAVAFALGILLGNLIFQVLRAITLSLFHSTYQFGFAFSIKSVGLSLLYFGVIYLLALMKSRRTINRMKIRDLIYLDRQNEGETIQKERTRRRVFVFSIISGVIGTILILLQNLTFGLIGAALIILFLYGFFISFSSGVPAYFARRPQQKYQGSTLLVFRTLSAKLATMGVVMATIALLFTGTIIAEGSGLLFHAIFQNRAEESTCFDLFISSAKRGSPSIEDYRAYVDAEIPTVSTWEYPVYLSKDKKLMEYVERNAEYYQIFEKDTIMRASDYTTLRAMLGYPAVELKPGEYVIHGMKYLENVLKQYQEPLNIGGQNLTPGGVYTESFTQALWDGNGCGYIFVVPDDAVLEQTLSHVIYAVMTTEPVTERDFEALCRIRDEKDEAMEGYDTLFSKASLERENASLYAMVVFPLYYLALVLTMTAATILTIHQLSETERYRRQFLLLRNLGMDGQELRGALRTQFLIFYAMPTLPPLLIGIPFITALGSTMDEWVLNSSWQLVGMVALAFGIFFAIYLVYIMAAYTSLKRGVLSE